MLLFAHAGIPLGIAWLAHSIASRAKSDLATAQPGWDTARDASGHSVRKSSPAVTLASRIDYRLILLGSVLPDIIDKPLGTWLLRDALGNGRIFGHTLLFGVLLVVAGIYLYLSHRRPSLLWLSFGLIAHLCLDQMWLCRRTLLWPLYGWSFEKMDVSNWLETVLTSLTTEPSVYVPEVIGAIVLGAFFLNLSRRGELYRFLRTGEAH